MHLEIRPNTDTAESHASGMKAHIPQLGRLWALCVCVRTVCVCDCACQWLRVLPDVHVYAYVTYVISYVRV